MSYLEDFKTQINNRDFSKFMQLWEEYCTSDSVESIEFIQLLQAIKLSDFDKLFGQLVETAIPLWKTIGDEKGSYEVLKFLFDLQTTNTPNLAELALEVLKNRYGTQKEFNERIRLIGLRSKDSFQRALGNYDLLAHMDKGKFVFHTGGWGTGEIVEVSPLREQLAVEFENIAGQKHITFANAFKTLIPLSNDDFRARRFADPDLLEKEAKEDPIAIIKVLLRDLGDKSAAEIKDELCERVIPDAEWSKWWQMVRTKLKKDTMIETPDSLKGDFRLRMTEETHEERLHHAIEGKINPDEIIHSSYNFVRDLPTTLKKHDVKNSLKERLILLLKDASLSLSQELQVLILLDMHFGHSVASKSLKEFISGLKDVEETINSIDIIAIKKKALSLVREFRTDWSTLFLQFLNSCQQGTLRDYLVKELRQGETNKELLKLLENLLNNPVKNPEFFVWYFQKLLSDEDLPFADKKGQCQFFEAFFILYSAIELKPEYRDLTKKMYNILSGKRYATVRAIIEGTDIEYIKEFLLLVSKCQTLSDHDVKILRSLAEVIHPSLAASKVRKSGHHDSHLIWTTEAGYLKMQERARQLGTVEVVENAREIEAARALGDLRENSEYKFALEKRGRIQSELKAISDQLNRARLITREDISPTEVGIGSVVEIKDSKNKTSIYTILGAWDADIDAFLLSDQSKFAQTMYGLKVGDAFQFRDDEFKIVSVKSYLDK